MGPEATAGLSPGMAVPTYAELSNPKPLSAEAAEALLGSDEALLVYLTTDEATWLWVLRRDDLAYYRIELGAKALAAGVGSSPQIRTWSAAP